MGKDIAPMVRALLKKMSITELRYVKAILLHDVEKSHTNSPAIRSVLADIQEIEQTKILTA